MEYIKIGKIVNTHGIKGELRIKSDFERKDLVFKKDFPLYISKDKKKEIISSYRVHKDFDMVTFVGYTNINEVLNYLKKDVYILKSDLNLKDNEYLLNDLIGMDVEDNSEIIGKITDFVYNNSNVLLVVNGVKQFYIPYNSYYIENVDTKKKIVKTNNAKDLIL
ncbi:MAG: ribosome maturation factor RimM [Bacilli bacterium]